MSIEGILLQPGEAQGVSLHGTQVESLVTAEHAKGCSVFEFSVAPGFDTGAHYHTKIEEIFCTRSVMLPSSGKGAISVSRRRGSLLS